MVNSVYGIWSYFGQQGLPTEPTLDLDFDSIQLIFWYLQKLKCSTDYLVNTGRFPFGDSTQELARFGCFFFFVVFF